MARRRQNHPGRQQIVVVFSRGDNRPLGTAWTITAKKTDFYITPAYSGGLEPFHVSLHGANDKFPTERFHIKTNKKAASQLGSRMSSDILRKGTSFPGEQVGADAFLVARLRWSWHLQRERFITATSVHDPPRPSAPGDHGYALNSKLKPNSVWDIDLVLSRSRPFWPSKEDPFKSCVHGSEESPYFGPLRNAAGLWLTGTSHHRSETMSPTPAALVPPLPRADETASRTCSGGITHEGFYWLYQTVTTSDFVEGLDNPG